MTERYLDKEGLERLVAYIRDELSNKLNKGEQVTLPSDLVYENDIEGFLTDIIMLRSQTFQKNKTYLAML